MYVHTLTRKINNESALLGIDVVARSEWYSPLAHYNTLYEARLDRSGLYYRVRPTPAPAPHFTHWTLLNFSFSNTKINIFISLKFKSVPIDLVKNAYGVYFQTCLFVDQYYNEVRDVRSEREAKERNTQMQ